MTYATRTSTAVLVFTLPQDEPLAPWLAPGERLLAQGAAPWVWALALLAQFAGVIATGAREVGACIRQGTLALRGLLVALYGAFRAGMEEVLSFPIAAPAGAALLILLAVILTGPHGLLLAAILLPVNLDDYQMWDGGAGDVEPARHGYPPKEMSSS